MGKGSKKLRAKRRKKEREVGFEITAPVVLDKENERKEREVGFEIDIDEVLAEADKEFYDELERDAPPGVDPLSWYMHFSDLPKGKKATCEDCFDYKSGVCEGDGDPHNCFAFRHEGEARNNDA
jgi:hypothetical protein